jgi:PEP-CTERM motif
MKQPLKSLLCIAALAALVGQAEASVVLLTWTTTVAANTTVPGAVIGETYTTTIKVDNGGSSTLSQNWGATNFLSFRQDGASGWWFESADLDLGLSSGSFITDALGAVTAAGNWRGLYPTGTVLTSWAGSQVGGWWNNGGNETSCLANSVSCVWADNVSENIVGSSWTARLDVGATVPEPASLGLVGLALLAAGAAAKRRR